MIIILLEIAGPRVNEEDLKNALAGITQAYGLFLQDPLIS